MNLIQIIILHKMNKQTIQLINEINLAIQSVFSFFFLAFT